MYFSRLFYFHLISSWSVLKHFLSLNTKAVYTAPTLFPVNEHLARQARQRSQAMLRITRSSASLSEAAWNLCVFAGPSDASDAMLALPAQPSGDAFTPSFISLCSILSRSSWRRGRSVWGGSASGRVSLLSVHVSPMRLTLHWAVPNMTHDTSYEVEILIHLICIWMSK